VGEIMSKKLTVKQISLNLAQDEVKRLEMYCNQTGRAKTDVIRELIRKLPD